jgi:HlyD family secretion protein
MARLEPVGKIHLVAPPVGHANEPVKTWLVQEGDSVRKGQPIAVMDSEALLSADLARAQAHVQRALAAKAQVEAGPKQGELQRQESEIVRLQRERSIGLDERDASIRRARAAEQTSTREWERYKRLLNDGAVSQSFYDQKEMEHLVRRQEREELEQAKAKMDATLQASVESARGELDRISEVRPTDVRLAQAEVDMALAEVQRVRTELEKTRVLSPIDGRVLEILTRTGETPKEGLVEIGQVQQMVAIAEVHQQDAGRVKVGMTAVVQSPALGEPVRGRVKKLGEQVLRQRIFSNIPGENFDQRVVEVEIALDMKGVPELSRLSNLQAEAIIEVSAP